jgi:deoxyribodipyrimidine photolyase-related protein
MDEGGPAGGSWNFDRENRQAFTARGPEDLPRSPKLANEAVTGEVLDLVAKRFDDHPGSLERFAWPVTPHAARLLLDEFIEHRLPLFGRYQDAMWTGEPFLYHSRLSVALNLKLIDPRTVIAAAEQAYRERHASLASVEGFIRQILGWREFVRGLYWHAMPGYIDSNALAAHRPLPRFYWTGETGMACLRECIGQTLEHGYAHHIQRLMVTGLFSLLLGVQPRQIHEWYLAIYVDAVEWVELPNVVGMSQYADGGLLASKPYAASGKYIQRMSNYCKGCRYDPGKAAGDDACPFTTLYWDFLMRHEERLTGNHRMGFQLRNLRRLDADRRDAIRRRANHVFDGVDRL